MARRKLNRPEVIEALCEQRDILGRLSVSAKMNPIFVEAIHLTRQKVDDLMTDHLETDEWDCIDRDELTELLEEVKTSELEDIRQRIARWTSKIRAHAKYSDGVEGYLKQDQEKIGGLHKRGLYQFLSTYAYEEIPAEPEITVFHGIDVDPNADFAEPTMGKKPNGHANGNGNGNGHTKGSKPFLMPAAQYADLLQKIVQGGLKSSPAPENLPDMESVFVVPELIQTYGLAGLKFNLEKGEKIWRRSPAPSEGMQIVKPLVKRPFEVYLKSPDFLDLVGEEGVGSESLLSRLDIDRFMNYQTRLEEELAKRGIPYVILDPYGVEV